MGNTVRVMLGWLLGVLSLAAVLHVAYLRGLEIPGEEPAE